MSTTTKSNTTNGNKSIGSQEVSETQVQHEDPYIESDEFDDISKFDEEYIDKNETEVDYKTETTSSKQRSWESESDRGYTDQSNVCDDGYQDGLGSTFDYNAFARKHFDPRMAHTRAKSIRHLHRGTAKDAITEKPDKYGELSYPPFYNDADNKRHDVDKVDRITEIVERLGCEPYLDRITTAVNAVDFDSLRNYRTIPIATLCITSLLTHNRRSARKDELEKRGKFDYPGNETYYHYEADGTTDSVPEPIEEMDEFVTILIENGALNDRLPEWTKNYSNSEYPDYKSHMGETMHERVLIGNVKELTSAKRGKLNEDLCVDATDIALPDFIREYVDEDETFYVNVENFENAKGFISEACSIEPL